MMDRRRDKRFEDENEVTIQYVLDKNSANNYLGINAIKNIGISGACSGNCCY